MVTIHYASAVKAELPKEQFFQTIRHVLKKYGLTDNVELELSIIGSQKMRRLNREYRHKDYATDVLSFPVWPDLATIKQQPGLRSLGSVIVCLPVALRDARLEHQDVSSKIQFLIEHSLLHLMGFHHEGDE